MITARIHELASRLAEQCMVKDEFSNGWYGFNGPQLEQFAQALLSESSGMVTHLPPDDTEGGEI